MSERADLPWLARYRWWHRVHGHRLVRGVGLLTPADAWRCEDCGRTWVRWLV